MNETIEVEAYVKSLHDGTFIQEGPAGRGIVNHNGLSAVLQIGYIDLLVSHHIFGNGDPQLYRACGIEPTLYKLIVDKACTSFRAAYQRFTRLIYEADTPGAAKVHLESLPFKKIPRTMYPFSSNGVNQLKVTRGRGCHSLITTKSVVQQIHCVWTTLFFLNDGRLLRFPEPMYDC
ncbi:hypothetical protein G4V62_05525 [Bacillaceae bacterium SIJ1]|uniref:MlrC C-terminal domain-containing protein n=1 Tax=Litoribacterium kuwaitense TaxID=1398745 RepID=UPI0013EC6347|nr:MlrC C-terminal domain-containing protein [Litoribacterium kuwaitense]NGP44441.1 hypothetical protein [Litoribacterium kuwaitense]